MTTASENPKPITAYCRTCGKPLTEDTVCIASGTVYCQEHLPQAAVVLETEPAAQPQSPYAQASVPNPNVSPGLAFLLGLIPGVGAIYNGQYAKGLVQVLIFGLLISIVSSDAAGGLEPMFGMLTAVFWFYMAFEAYHTAKKRMMGEAVDEFSSLIKINPYTSQTPVLPVLLIVLGVVFLLNNFGILRLGQLLKFWPALLIAAGVWMMYVRMRGRPELPVEPPAVEVNREQ